jgi:hypothetical protein
MGPVMQREKSEQAQRFGVTVWRKKPSA